MSQSKSQGSMLLVAGQQLERERAQVRASGLLLGRSGSGFRVWGLGLRV